MTALSLNQLSSESTKNVLDRYRVEFQEKLKKEDADLLNFQDFAVKALNKIGVVGVVAPLSSSADFTINELDGNLMARIKELPKPTDEWAQELQAFVHDWIQMRIGSTGVNLSVGAYPAELEKGVKEFIKWHEEYYLSILQDLSIDEELTKYINEKGLKFNENGDEI